MGVQTLVPLEEYLDTSYSPDREYRDGVLVERSVGDKAHARLQALLTMYLGSREALWNIEVYTELRVQVRDRILQCKMILKRKSFPMQDDPEIRVLPSWQVDANSDEERGAADAATDR